MRRPFKAVRRARTAGTPGAVSAVPASAVPFHRSLRVKLLLSAVVITLCSVSATAWLAARTATVALRQEQGQRLADDALIYDSLLGRAGRHRSWHGVNAQVKDLSRRTERRITLVNQEHGTVIATTASDSRLPDRAAAVINPLRTDTGLTGSGTTAPEIDPRAVGPYRITADERRDLDQRAAEAAACIRKADYPVIRTTLPNGHPVVRAKSQSPGKNVGMEEACLVRELDAPVAGERRALGRLNTWIRECARREGILAAPVGMSFTATDPQLEECVLTARRRQLTPYVAPPAVLYLSTPATAPGPIGIDLSSANVARIVGAAALVLLLTVSVTALVGARLVRPLRALTGAALAPDGDTRRVRVTTHDEIGHLATAFNDLSARREAAEEQRKAMVADIAHELRNPLSNMRGWLEAAQDGVAVPGEFTGFLLDEALQLQHLVDDLQDLAAADAGVLALHPEHLFAADLMGQVISAHRAAAAKANVTIGLAITGEPPLYADPVRLKQALGNLVSNAVQHTPSGGTVTLTATVDSDMVVLAVSDTGPGIAPEHLERVFERFWRADPSRSRRTGGSGLGLAIVRQLVLAHGGTVDAHSTPGGPGTGTGTTFTLRLPAAAPATEAGEYASVPPPSRLRP